MGGFVRDPIYGKCWEHVPRRNDRNPSSLRKDHSITWVSETAWFETARVSALYLSRGYTRSVRNPFFSLNCSFQHCIGVYHLAEVFINHLQKAQPELEITEQEKLAVCIGGLVHDLGHVMLCHMYPRYVQYCKNELPLSHELMSVLIFRSVIQKWGLSKDFLEYGMDENVSCSIRFSYSVHPTHLWYYSRIQRQGMSRIPLDRRAWPRISAPNRGQCEVSIGLAWSLFVEVGLMWIVLITWYEIAIMFA